MFAADRWALAFAGALEGEGALEEGLDLLKALAPGLRDIPGMVSGYAAGAQMDRLIRRALEAVSPGAGAEKVRRFLVLLVRKGRFRRLDAVIRETEKILDEKRGTVPVYLETAFPPGDDGFPAGAFEGELKALLCRRTGAREIRLETRVVPELLAGCRLRLGSESLDASLRARLGEMAKDLGKP